MNSKKKTLSHLIENESIKIIEKKLPSYWTIRNYKPDYGLDLAVEVFEETSDGNDYETLGEHFFIQVKGTKNISKISKKIKSEYNNVEKKGLYEELRDETKEIEVIKFEIETSELYTIERMGSSIPVFLFLVDINSEVIYFICLNDYIDKVITPHDPEYLNKKNKVIYIPTNNIIDEHGIDALRFYSQRSKMYSFFIEAEYQRNEMKYINDEDLHKVYRYFIDRLLRHDVWKCKVKWPLMESYHKKLLILKEKGTLPEVENLEYDERNDDEIWTIGYSNKEFKFKDAMLYMNIRMLWDGLASICHVYEEDCREWFLPTYYNVCISED